MTPNEALLQLPLTIESYALDGLSMDVSTGFTRHTTIVRLQGAGEEGQGEDVTYSADDQLAFQGAGPVLASELAAAGATSLAGFSRLLDRFDLYAAGGPSSPSQRLYRRWAFESAALDLALRQAKTSLGAALGREAQPVRFVASTSLGNPPTLEPVTKRLAIHSDLRFKLDPRSSWGDALIQALVETGAVDTLDLKGQYKGTVVDNPADPEFYARITSAFPEAWIEDPGLDASVLDVLEPLWPRITWDATFHALSDLLTLPHLPRAVNVKPSRFGFLSEVLRTFEFCEARGIQVYGGGQFELGVGRGQIQYLASLFHPEGPNDVAPGGYNANDPAADLPGSPLAPAPSAIGFRWGEA